MLASIHLAPFSRYLTYAMHLHLFREPVSALTHFAWMLLAVPATWLLVRRAGTDPCKRLGANVFGVSLFLCYAGSWLYHSCCPCHVNVFHTLDHVGIYLLIAGTVTPIGLVVLDGWWRRGLVGGIWLLAVLGIGLRLSADVSMAVMTGLYLFMGWIGCLTYFELARRLTHARLRLLLLGGFFYTLGAVLNSVGWPILLPGVFEAHELFHVLVMAGSACHYLFVLNVVLPYEKQVPVLTRLQRPAASASERKPERSLVLTAAGPLD